MARMPRIVVPGQTMHIVQRGNNRQAIFFADDDYLKYMDLLKSSSEKFECSVHAYVLMTNHVHLLVTPETGQGVSRMMQAIGRSYVRYINGVYRRSGTLWEGRFKSALIDSEHYLLACSRYIELNPVRAKMVAYPEEYRWSSYRANCSALRDELLSPHKVYLRLGRSLKERAQAYKSLFKTNIGDSTINSIRVNTEKEIVLGSNKFEEEIQRTLNRRVKKFDHGGDRKGKSFEELSSVLTP